MCYGDYMGIKELIQSIADEYCLSKSLSERLFERIKKILNLR